MWNLSKQTELKTFPNTVAPPQTDSTKADKMDEDGHTYFSPSFQQLSQPQRMHKQQAANLTLNSLTFLSSSW